MYKITFKTGEIIEATDFTLPIYIGQFGWKKFINSIICHSNGVSTFEFFLTYNAKPHIKRIFRNKVERVMVCHLKKYITRKEYSNAIFWLKKDELYKRLVIEEK